MVASEKISALNVERPSDHPLPECLELLRNRINLTTIPFSERGSRLMLSRKDDSLAIRLAERWYKLDGQLSSYRTRKSVITNLVLLDGSGALLPFTQSTLPNEVVLHTSLGDVVIFFVDGETLLFTLPAGPMGISFETTLDTANVDRRGGVLRMEGDIRRNIAWTTNAHILANDAEAFTTEEGVTAQRVMIIAESDGDDALMLNITPRLGFNRYIPDIQKAREAAAQRWVEWFQRAPTVREDLRADYYYAWWIMRSGLISTRFYTTREAMTPSKIYYVGVWQWDAYFHALAYRHVEPRLAADQLRIVIDHQREDGMIPDAIHDEGVVTRLNFPVEADVTKPPLLAWTAWKLYEMDGDREFLEEVYEPIVRWNRWWLEQNDRDGNGLCEYGHPFSSGLDDSPLWDQGMPVEAPDLNTYLVMQMEALAKIAREIGLKQEAEEWDRKSAAMAERMMEVMWDEEAGLFWALHEGKRVDVRTPFSLYPLMTGKIPPEVTARLVEHLTDPESFWTRYPVPTVAKNDPKYAPTVMWRGPVWLNVNYLLIDGLQRAGYGDIARELRRRTLKMVNRAPDIFEFYHPEDASIPPKAAPLFGWSAALFIELAIQESVDHNINRSHAPCGT